MTLSGARRAPWIAATGVVLASLFGVSPAPAAPYALGVDVSHWDGAIDWNAVATDSQHVTFAIEKATSGRTNTDAKYEVNRTGALTHGIVVAAYHFAYPDSTPGDAVAEADHFVDTAGLADGKVIPALDLEGDGLAYWKKVKPAQLVAWTSDWLERVRARTGIHALIYSSPAFWRSHMGDTSAFARAGYPLWIANWDTGRPDVPGDGWAGQGWRCWQYSDHGRVAGIPTRVDLDYFDVSSLASAPQLP